VIRGKGRHIGWLLILEKPFRKKSLALPVIAITGIQVLIEVDIQRAFDEESERD
jgi:hypothetical protein